MNSFSIKKLMVPVSEYTTVSENATMAEAVNALRKAQEKFQVKRGEKRFPHLGVLIQNKKKKIIGKLSPQDIIKAVIPKYPNQSVNKHVSRFGFNEEFLKSMHDQYLMFDKTAEYVCRRVGEQKVKKFIYVPSEGELIKEDASVGEALQRLEIKRRRSLLVTRKDKIVGILKLTDVVSKICELIINDNPDK
jgi:CBS domain-containing protein